MPSRSMYGVPFYYLCSKERKRPRSRSMLGRWLQLVFSLVSRSPEAWAPPSSHPSQPLS